MVKKYECITRTLEDVTQPLSLYNNNSRWCDMEISGVMSKKQGDQWSYVKETRRSVELW